ncbi:hypothetical protein SAMN06272781_4354 [Streptomyces sp. 1222.2]|uniref:Uncharacterized protein n=1 Tax=Streptomyces stelliscabiei TaxID=146820 RepID=A0A8I0P976_9ACTN|nr:hypothetical protein [Streptomyces stelliscabiei]SOD76506.1 hypothetical protein SAMN06272781_4354 [Streptomyces sp. 1222.2]
MATIEPTDPRAILRGGRPAGLQRTPRPAGRNTRSAKRGRENSLTASLACLPLPDQHVRPLREAGSHTPGTPGNPLLEATETPCPCLPDTRWSPATGSTPTRYR